MTVRCLLSLLCLILLQPAMLHAQSAEEDDGEMLRALATSPAADDSLDLSKVSQQIIRQTNAFRKSEGLDPVEPSQALQETAQYFADFMARTDKYGHTADGQRPSQRAKKHGYEFCLVSENIAYQYSSAGFKADELSEAFVEGWKNSPGHRKNMLEGAATETGVAVARSSETGHYYAVQMFGRPKSLMIEFSVRNDAETTIKYQLGERSFPLPPRYTRTHQRCRPAEVSFRAPEGEGKIDTVEVDGGEQLVVSGGDKGLQVTNEEME